MNIEESSYRCFMRGSGDCKGEVRRFQVGLDFIDICVRHCVLLKETLTEEGF